jgi:phage-related holin
MRMQDSAFAAVYQAAPPAAQATVAGAMVVITAVWHAFTGVLAAIMVLLFLVDLGLGVLRALHMGGLKAFCRDRFWRAFLKLAAAMMGVVLAVSVDLLLRHIGTFDEATYFTSGILGGVSLGFLVSAGESLAYFFPAVGLWMDALVRRLRDPGEMPRRRASDQGVVRE